jgi:hypothetical protein
MSKPSTKWNVCPLCDRPIPPRLESRHHLVPRLKGGSKGPCIVVHSGCHSKIHAELTESELARDYNTVETLRSHPAIARFLDWIAERPPDLRVRNRSLRKRKPR